jgi:hypothetical protein
MIEYHVNVWGTPDARYVEAWADGESFGRVLTDQSDPLEAARDYLAPFDLEVDETTHTPLLDLLNGVQFRAVESDGNYASSIKEN